MNRKTTWLFFLLALILSACASTPAAAPIHPPTVAFTASVLAPTIQSAALVTPTVAPGLPQSEADVPRVTVEEAKAAFERGEAVIVDVRNAAAFAESHVTGAASVPLALIEEDPSSVSFEKDRWIITYCT